MNDQEGGQAMAQEPTGWCYFCEALCVLVRRYYCDTCGYITTRALTQAERQRLKESHV